MNILARGATLNALAARVTAPFVSLLLLATRLYVSWQFLISGWLKVTNWDTTLALFEDEYHVPVLPPHVAAVAGAAGEITFPILLILGLFTRYAAAGLSFVNIMAVVSYANVLLAEGSEAALGQHKLWGYMLLVIMVFGPGRIAADSFMRQARQSR